jgi:hypothetical protein
MLKKIIALLIITVSIEAAASWFSSEDIPTIDLGWWNEMISIADCQWDTEPLTIECTLTTYIDIPSNGIAYQARNASGVIMQQGNLPNQRLSRNTKVRVNLHVKGASTISFLSPSLR